MKIDYFYKNLVSSFLKLEIKYNLLDIVIDNVYFWQNSRINIYFEILNKKLPTQNITISRHKTKLMHRLFINSLLFNPFFTKKKHTIIFESGRRIKEGNKYIDIYTHYLCEKLIREKINFIQIETNYNIDFPLVKRNKRNRHIDFILLMSKFIAIFQKNKLREKDEELIVNIEKDINTMFEINIDLISIIKRDIKTFKSEFFLYTLLFKWIKPKDIYIINAGMKPSLVAAAKNMGIRVNELQHGLTSSYGIVNHFPNSKVDKVNYYPDRFFKWDNIQLCFSTIPLSQKYIINFKNEYIENKMQEYNYIKKNDKMILVISQPSLTNELIDFLSKNVTVLANFKLYFKLHPLEKREDIVNNTFFKNNNLNISIVHDEISIYELMSRSKYVIGVFSTALFEAICFKCRVILLNLPGVELALPILTNENASLININDKLELL